MVAKASLGTMAVTVKRVAIVGMASIMVTDGQRQEVNVRKEERERGRKESEMALGDQGRH